MIMIWAMSVILLTMALVSLCNYLNILNVSALIPLGIGFISSTIGIKLALLYEHNHMESDLKKEASNYLKNHTVINLD